MRLEFSDYEQNMIGFLMGHGMSEELAEQSVVDERLEQFQDINQQLTYENQWRTPAPMKDFGCDRSYRMGQNQQEKIRAFREHIGERQWRELCGDTTNTILLTLAIDFNYEK